MRYPHYLKKCSAGQWPTLVLSVECQGGPARQGVDESEERQQLDQWVIIGLARQDGQYVTGNRAVGVTPEGFWSTLAYETQKYSHTLILSSNCLLVWQELQFWEKLENEEIALKPDPQSPQGDGLDTVHAMREEVPEPRQQSSTREMLRLHRERSGYLVLCGGAKIACFRFPARKGVITWVDVRNFGVACRQGEGEKSSLGRKVLQWFLSAHDAAVSYNLGSIGNTAASWAFRSFKGSYMEDTILVHNNKTALKMEEASYHGGRCEVFRLGRVESTIWHLDFRSLYPYVCTTTALPVRLRTVEVGNPSQRLPDGVDPVSAIARVSLHTEEPAYPLERGGIVIYPVGRFTTTLAGPELANAYDAGRIIKWHSWATYDMSYALIDYARKLYELRCRAEDDGDENLAAMAKRMLVALPGKFGGREYSWIPCPNEPAEKPYGYWPGKDKMGNPITFRSIGWNVEKQVVTGFHPEAVPAIATWITSAGRMRLFDALKCAGREHVVYCDTDSVMVDEHGFNALTDYGIARIRQLGFLDIKSKCDNVEILGIKHYREDGRLVCSGLPLDSPDRGEYACECQTEVSPLSFIRKGMRPEYVEVRANGGRYSTYQHGTVEEDGRVIPIELNEW